MSDIDSDGLPPLPASRVPHRPAPAARQLPHSVEAEENLISACFVDSLDVMSRAIEAGVGAESFYQPKNSIVFGCMMHLMKNKLPVDLAVVAEELKASKQLDAIGGYAFLIEVSGRVSTTVQAAYFIEKIRKFQAMREIIRASNAITEAAYNADGDATGMIEQFRLALTASFTPRNVEKPRGIFDYEVPPPNDSSILLGNRYFVRGDAGVVVGTSGTGKSSISIQMAVTWALGLPFFKIPPNGKLRSLIIQAEDSEGDIAEVVNGMAAGLNLTPEQIKSVNENVLVVTERTRRGNEFLARLRHLVEEYKPDLVWINPLQSFMSGDLTKGEDLGKFLREGLNSINTPPRFGIIVVHHTTKPPAEKVERSWSEVMYDMAGGAEIINWARFIMSLRADENQGEFRLVLAKRGRRAGVTKRVEQGAGERDEIVTTIKLRHAIGTHVVNGITIPLIFWESDEDRVEKSKATKKGPGLDFGEIKSAIPRGFDNSATWPQIKRSLSGKKKVSEAALADALIEWARDGLIKSDASDPNTPKYYL